MDRSLLNSDGIKTRHIQKKAHSVKGAAVQIMIRAFREDLIKIADWANASTFKQFYCKPIKTTKFSCVVLGYFRNSCFLQQRLYCCILIVFSFILIPK